MELNLTLGVKSEFNLYGSEHRVVVKLAVWLLELAFRMVTEASSRKLHKLVL